MADYGDIEDRVSLYAQHLRERRTFQRGGQDVLFDAAAWERARATVEGELGPARQSRFLTGLLSGASGPRSHADMLTEINRRITELQRATGFQNDTHLQSLLRDYTAIRDAVTGLRTDQRSPADIRGAIETAIAENLNGPALGRIIENPITLARQILDQVQATAPGVTPSPGASPPAVDPAPSRPGRSIHEQLRLDRSLSGPARIRSLQRLAMAHGISVGPTNDDGLLGPRTREGLATLFTRLSPSLTQEQRTALQALLTSIQPGNDRQTFAANATAFERSIAGDTGHVWNALSRAIQLRPPPPTGQADRFPDPPAPT